MLKEYPDILSVSQLAEILGICRNSAYNLLKNHIIGYKRIGRKYIIPKSCVISYLESARYTVAQL